MNKNTPSMTNSIRSTNKLTNGKPHPITLKLNKICIIAIASITIDTMTYVHSIVSSSDKKLSINRYTPTAATSHKNIFIGIFVRNAGNVNDNIFNSFSSGIPPNIVTINPVIKESQYFGSSNIITPLSGF